MRGALLLLLTASCAAQTSTDSDPFSGTWILRAHGQNLGKLTIAGSEGSVTWPRNVSRDQGGIKSIDGGYVTQRIQRAERKDGKLHLTIDDDPYTMTIESPNLGWLSAEGELWRLER